MTGGRPRHAPWVVETPVDGDRVLLEKSKGKEARVELDRISTVIWRACNGRCSLEELSGLFAEAYPDDAGVARQVEEAVEQLVRQEFLLIDGGESVLDGHGDGESSGATVTHLTPGVELQWQLELLRQFLFGVLRVAETASIDSDVDRLLNDDALVRAKQLDLDAASQAGDSNIIRYKGSMKSPSFKACMDAAIRELEDLIPESRDKLELSGNAIYLRGAHMGWHSNHSRADRRVYCSWAERPDSNFFRYEHPITGEIVTEWEQPGWTIKTFSIPAPPARFWHCIGASSLRLSLGFRYSVD